MNSGPAAPNDADDESLTASRSRLAGTLAAGRPRPPVQRFCLG